ncbi:MAG: PAS domain S-box protein [Acidobacteriota bacterium]|nr:PAS domain S-box protein [Acidobacteriota bacterium]
MSAKPSYRVLLAENNPAHVEAIRRAFEAAGPAHEIRVAGTVIEFREAARAHPPDIAVLDMTLPDGSAFEALSSTGPFPFLIMTCPGDGKIAAEAMKKGALGCVVKSPQAFTDMPRTVERALSSWNIIRERREVEAVLETSHERYTHLADGVIDIFFAFDKDLRYIYWSKAFEQLTNITARDAIGRSLYEVFPDTRQTRASGQNYRQALETGRPVSFMREYRSGETSLFFEIHAYPSVGGLSVFARNITDRRRMEETLRESEERFRSLFENATIGLYRTTPDGSILMANPVLIRMLGYSSFDELAVRNLRGEDFEPSYPRAEFIEMMERENQVIGLESVWRRKDGVSITVRESAWTVRNPDGKIMFYEGIAEDVTERERAREEIRRKTALLEAINRLFMETLASGTSEGVGRLCLDLALKITGSALGLIGEIREDGRFNILAVESLTGGIPTATNGLFPGNLREMEFGTFWQRVLKTGKSIVVNQISEFPEPIIFPEGHPEICFFMVVPFFHSGKTIGMIGLANKESGYGPEDREMIEGLSSAFIEVLFRKRTEEAQRQAEENFHRSIEESPFGIRIVSPEGETLYANRAILDIYGYGSLEELNAVPIQKRYTPESFAEFKNRNAARRKGCHDPSDYEVSIVTKKGEIRRLQVCRKKIIWNGKQRFQVIYQDITARKQAEDSLLNTLEQLRKSVRTTIDVLHLATAAKDPYTAGHALKVTRLAAAIATGMGLPTDQIDCITMAGHVHDIGKISVPSEVLCKPMRLSSAEILLIREHVRSGYEILKDVKFPWPLADIVYQHHERMDGSGYPRGLKGADILLEARIIAVADVVEAMASHRPYREALGIEAALEEIRRNRGSLYDDQVSDMCLKLFREKGFRFEDFENAPAAAPYRTS